MGATVAGKPRHNKANGGHREVEKATAILTNTYATTDSEGDGRRRAPKGDEVLSTMMMAFRRRAAATEGWKAFTSQLRTQRRRRRSLATTEGVAGPRRRSKRRGELVLNGDEGLPVVFSFGEMAAGLPLDLAEPREVATLTCDGRGDGARRLDRRPEVERRGAQGGRFRRRRKTGLEGMGRGRLGVLYIGTGAREFLGEIVEEIEGILFPQLIWKEEQRRGRIW
uniref:DUF834 domain-containing protein n=1 Tax=Oryza sativa subsp. japonica TaxID=39947 RepID=Q67U16_ORYSJ|nr:hypothetical protein [Oryza sativa Japonica Group]